VLGVLVDAGPLVALVDRGDAHHGRCVEALKAIRDPLMTVWPAVTEAMFLLRDSWAAQAALLEMLESGAIGLLPLDEEDVPRITGLMAKYRDLPMDLADAALVRVAERERIRHVFTIDQRDFRLYRPAGLGRFSLIPLRL
jgi:predicted nucleic acid-binding protein